MDFLPPYFFSSTCEKIYFVSFYFFFNIYHSSKAKEQKMG